MPNTIRCREVRGGESRSVHNHGHNSARQSAVDILMQRLDPENTWIEIDTYGYSTAVRILEAIRRARANALCSLQGHDNHAATQPQDDRNR